MLLEIKNVSKTFGRNRVLDHVSFSVDNGEFVVLAGPEGLGKTVMLSMIAGKIPCRNGQILLEEGKSLGHLFDKSDILSGNSIYKELLTVVETNKDLKEKLHTMELAMMYMKGDAFRGVQKDYEALNKKLASIEENGNEYLVSQVLELTGFGEEDYTRMIGYLPEATQLRVALAKQLMLQPHLLVIDDPDSFLTKELFLNVISYMKEQGIALLAASRNPEWFEEMPVRIVEL